MIDSTTTLRPASQATTRVAQALITEQQLMFSTAAAVAAPVKARGWADVIGRVRAFFADSREPVQRHYPKRSAYLESSVMAREMDRL